MNEARRIWGFWKDDCIEYTINPKHDVRVTNDFAITGISYAENGCCEDRPILITVTRATINLEKPIYSCQCACGLWCTTGHTSDWEALKDYEEMTRRSKEEKRNEAV